MVSSIRRFFVVALAASWGFGLVGLMVAATGAASAPFSPSSPFYWLAGYAISLTGVAMTAIYDGRSGLDRLVERLLPWRARPIWYVALIGGFMLVTVVARRLAALSGATLPPTPGLVGFFGGLSVTLFRDVGPLGEELGWRGFAMPRLIEHRGPVLASLILGVVHAIWHLPLFFIAGLPQSHLSFPTFAVGVLAMSVIDTWIYLRTAANLLLAILVHALANYCGSLFGPDTLQWFFAAEGAAAMAVVIGGGLRAPKSGSR